MSMSTFERYLKSYAELAILVGLNLQRGQKLALTGGGSGTALIPFMRQVTETAYLAGASYVDTHIVDEKINLIRLQEADEESFDYYPAWQRDRILNIVEDGGAMLNISASNPSLLAGIDAQKVARMNQSRSMVRKPISDALVRGAMNWLNVSIPSSSWAAQVFPELPAEEQQSQLWQKIFNVLRLNEDDPIIAWRHHIQQLKARSQYLTTRQYEALSFRGPGTDLKVGLVQGHVWQGGSSVTEQGIEFTPNMPTEEIFTLPHRAKCEGYVESTKPFSFRGVLVEDLRLTFRKGKVVEVTATHGEGMLNRLLDTDDGARYLGEIALVPHSSPISAAGFLFLNTLFDENAASHMALGQGYNISLQDGAKLTNEEFYAAGGNQSAIHVDIMIGSQTIDVDGVKSNGVREPLMRSGEWAFDI